MNFKDYHKKASDKELLDDLKRVAIECSYVSMAQSDYAQNGKFDCTTFCRRFGKWNKALKLAGLELRNKMWTEEELFDNLEKVWVFKGSQPCRRDMDNKQISFISNGAYLRKFGKWSEALKAFVNYINQYEICNEDIYDLKTSQITKRDINLRLRFIVLQRDNFKCCTCGASPAKEPGVILHVDHIIPWSKGGETVIDNLQTLCSKCNWGKGNSK